ncbi:MAG: CBS domain-containing protein [Desulfobacteraceae bacterium]|jgi:nanoRNase/pAp phosphatase (c-di-AMP/oligoRNAs hydrolase)
MKIISTHKGMDFDALASVIAASLLYPDAVTVMSDNMNPNVKAFLSLHKELFHIIAPGDINLSDVKTLIVVDACNWNRLDGIGKLKERKDLEIIIWDHHVGGDIHATWKCQEHKGAAVTLITRKLIEKNINLSPIIATLLLMGIYEDTGNLTFSSTTAEDASTCAYLLDRKADLTVLNSFLRPAYGEKQKNILFEMMGTTVRRKIRGYKLAFCQVKLDSHIGNLSVVVSMYRDLENVDGAFGIFHEEKKNKCIIIGRSSHESLDIGKLMRNLGGGGHPGAGSAMVQSEFLNPEAVIEMITELIDGHQRSSVQLSDLMSYPVHTVSSDMTMEEVAQLLRQRGFSGLPVVEEGRIVGVISRRDFRKMRKEAHMKSPVKAYMSKEIITIDSGKSPLEAVRLMIKHDIGRVPVIQQNEIIGILTRTDAMRYYYNLLPD